MRPQTKARSPPLDASISVSPEDDLHAGESAVARGGPLPGLSRLPLKDQDSLILFEGGQVLSPPKSSSGTSTEVTISRDDTTSWEVHSIERSAADQSLVPGAEQSSRKAKDSKSWHPKFIFKQLAGRASAAKSWASTEFVSERRVWNIWKHANDAKNVETEELTEDDTIIALMGSTGTGKSSFISKAVGRDVGIGHGLQSCTNKINAIRVQVPGEHFGLVLVDTPGFDDTRRSHAEVLELVSCWLEQICKKKVLLSGILYLHRIPDNRMAGTPLKSLTTFERLCGTESCNQIIMVTTMWDALVDEGVGKRREEELKSTFWEPMMRRGSSTQRYKNTEQSAWNILEQFLHAPRERRERCLERELIDLQGALSKAATGKGLSTTISKFLEEQEPQMRVLREQMRQMDVSDEAFTALQEEYRKLEGQRHELLTKARTLRKELQGTLGPPDHPRALLSSVLGRFFDKAVAVVEGLDSKDVRPMADFLSLALSEEGIILTDEGNRILTLLTKIATSAQVYPQRFELKKVRRESDRPIARGGSAEVYRGQYENRMVCVKIVIFGCDHAILIKESTLWAHLSHPNILPFYGVFREKNTQRMGLVSPWMEKGNLCDYSKKLTQNRRMPLISDTLEGLLYLHQLGIVHSDIKARNVLVSGEGRALITDFGASHIAIANPKSEFTKSFVSGTIGWIAPELHQRENQVRVRPTKPCDVWSFGSLCYEVLSRKVPFYQLENDHQVKEAVLEGEYPLRPDPNNVDCDAIDNSMWDLLKCCWKMRPESRPSCETIRGVLTANMGTQDERPPAKVTVGAVGKAAAIDYHRVKKVLRRIQDT